MLFLFFSGALAQSLSDCVKNAPVVKKEAIAFVQSILKDQIGKSQKLSYASENMNRLQCAFSKLDRSGNKPNFTLMGVYNAYYSLPAPIELIGV